MDVNKPVTEVQAHLQPLDPQIAAVRKKRGMFAAIQETYLEFAEKDGMTQAAAVAFYSGLSLAPLLTLVTWLATLLFGTDSKRQIVRAFEEVIGRQAAAPIGQILDPASEHARQSFTIAGLVSLAIVVFSASGVFAQLQAALNAMWEVRPKPSAGWGDYLRKRLLSMGMLLTLLFLLLTSLVISTVIQGLLGSGHDNGMGWIVWTLQLLISLAIFSGLFALMYRYLPDVSIGWNDVWVGGVVAAVLFSVGKFALGLYLGRGSYESSYGAAVGSFVALLVWVYYTAIIVFVGAEATRVWSRRFGHRAVPEPYAARVVTQTGMV